MRSTQNAPLRAPGWAAWLGARLLDVRAPRRSPAITRRLLPWRVGALVHAARCGQLWRRLTHARPCPRCRPLGLPCSLLGLLLAPLCIERFGWPSVFYLFGGMGLLWCVWWEKLVAEVREKEPELVAALTSRGGPPDPAAAALQQQRQQLGDTALRIGGAAAVGAAPAAAGEAAGSAAGHGGHGGVIDARQPVPWRSFLRNPPLRALAYTHFCNSECRRPAAASRGGASSAAALGWREPRWWCASCCSPWSFPHGPSSLLTPTHSTPDTHTDWYHYTMLAWLPTYFSDSLSLSLAAAAQVGRQLGGGWWDAEARRRRGAPARHSCPVLTLCLCMHVTPTPPTPPRCRCCPRWPPSPPLRSRAPLPTR